MVNDGQSAAHIAMCPEDKTRMIGTWMKYGVRYCCNEPGCPWYQWGGSTSTPTTPELSQLRAEAHKVFDALWKSRHVKRTQAYRWLANALGITESEAHFGKLNEEQIRFVLRIFRERSQKYIVNEIMEYERWWRTQRSRDLMRSTGRR